MDIVQQMKVGSNRNLTSNRRSNDKGDIRSLSAHALKMSEMYMAIGRTEETVQLIDETLNIFKRGGAAVVANLSQNDDSKVEVGAGYTKRDVKALEADELELIVRLLKLKGDALTRLHGAAGFRMSAKINIDGK